ncbi:MAG TPA: hypothetical protein VMG59_13920 [Phycisphaerae bacterium]|nr:hypothetical protein [Phycisphaerae bacterium]
MNAPEANAWVYELAESISRSPKFRWLNETDRYDAAMDAAVNTLPHLVKFNPVKSGPDGIRGYASRIIFRQILKAIKKENQHRQRAREDTRAYFRPKDCLPLIRDRDDRQRVGKAFNEFIKRAESFDDDKAQIIRDTLLSLKRAFLGRPDEQQRKAA